MSIQTALRLLAAVTALALAAPLALAQRWEFGGGGGASFYTAQSISGSAGSADVKFKPGFGGTAYFGQIGDRVGGEVRYDWFSNEMELSGAGKSFTRSGYTQSIHYDALFYFSRKNAKVRPYVLGGGGMKQYVGTGQDVAVQPLMNIAVLTRTSEWKPLIVAGGGVRFAVGKKAQMRAEVLAFMTPTPNKVVTPVNGSLSGWTFNFAPLFSLSYVW
jgi:hypothetical protein